MTREKKKRAREEAWIAFVEQGLDDFSFDRETRPKTFKAVRECFMRIPRRWWEKLPDFVFFAPSPHDWGECIPWFEPASNIDRRSVLVYLSPDLEKRTQREVNSTVAHELAHAILRHDRGNRRQEEEADRLIARWGFTETNSGDWKARAGGG